MNQVVNKKVKEKFNQFQKKKTKYKTKTKEKK